MKTEQVYKQDIATWLGISPSHYSNYVNQGKPLGRDVLVRVHQLTGIPIGDLSYKDRDVIRKRIENRYRDFIDSLVYVKNLRSEIIQLRKGEEVIN